MSGNADKTKFSIRVDTKLLDICDEYIEKTDTLNRTDFIESALKFYIGFLTSKNIENYLLQTLSSVLTSTIRDTENRLASIDFKVAVELSKLAHVIAYSHDIDEATLNKLHIKCLDEVKRINGAVDFESANKYQKYVI
jgi:metal-responsive CopG/Arc/MetJ family transcriptional regulator